MVLWSLGSLKLLVTALSSCWGSNGQSLLGVVLGVKNGENVLGLLLVRLKVDLLNRNALGRTNSLVSIKSSSLVLHAIHVVTGDVNVLSKDTLKLVPNVLIVRNVFVCETLKMVENVLHLLNILGCDPKFLLRVVETFRLDVLNLVHCVFLLFSPLQFLVEEVQYHEV